MKHCPFLPKGGFHLPALSAPSPHSQGWRTPSQVPGPTSSALAGSPPCWCALTSLQKPGSGFTPSVLNPNPNTSRLHLAFLSLCTRLLVIPVPTTSALSSVQQAFASSAGQAKNQTQAATSLRPLLSKPSLKVLSHRCSTTNTVLTVLWDHQLSIPSHKDLIVWFSHLAHTHWQQTYCISYLTLRWGLYFSYYTFKGHKSPKKCLLGRGLPYFGKHSTSTTRLLQLPPQRGSAHSSTDFPHINFHTLPLKSKSSN